MAGNDYRQVSTGDPLRIPAPVWNELLRRTHPLPFANRAGSSTSNNYTRNAFNPSLVRVRNDHTALTQFSVLGVEATVITDPPTSAATLLGWKQIPTVAGDVPALASHFGKFVVLIEDIDASGYGMAVASGIVPVQIDVLDADHIYADVKDSDAAKLQSRAMGSARIVWKESGTGTKWAIVNIGVMPPAMFPVQVEQTGGSAGDETTQCSFTYTVRDVAGYTIATDASPLKRRPAVGAMSAPDSSFEWGVGFYEADGTFHLWDANETLDAEAC